MQTSPLRAELLFDLDTDTADETAEAFEDAWLDTLHRIGVEAEGLRALPHRDPGGLDWLVLLSLPLQAFLGALGTEALGDLYAKAKQLARDRLRGKAKPRPPLVLEDAGTGLRIVLEPDLPPAALEQLTALDLTRFRLGPLHYDRSRKAWRSVADEADE
ncbi:hypothetical protein AB0B28_17045 [Glycomyces sp. NPDC046736]|uniref:hypothetical protein n=1 Tax=Glycomyces sp. NPDC046736 TaxID=3155615 RepID=UPI0033EB5132